MGARPQDCCIVYLPALVCIIDDIIAHYSTMHRLWLKVLEQRSTELPGERKGHGQVFGFFLGDLLLLCL